MTLADLWALAFATLGALLLWVLMDYVVAARDRAAMRWLVMGGFVARAGISVMQHKLFEQYYKFFSADTRQRYFDAVQNADSWHQGLWQPPYPTSLGEAHSLVIELKTTVLVYLFGPSPHLAEAFTVFAGASIALAVYLICRHIRCTRTSTLVAVALNAFLPSLIFWSAQDLKDPVLAMCVAWSVLGMIKMSSRLENAGYIALMVAMNLLALVYRPYVGILLIGGQALAWTYSLPLPKTQIGNLVRAGLFLLIAPFAWHFVVSEMQSAYGEEMSLQWAVDSYDIYQEAAIADQGSQYIIPLHADTPVQALIQLPLRILLLVLSPVPIKGGSFARLFMYPEMWFLYIFAIWRFGKGMREIWVKHRQIVMSLLLQITPIVVAYAMKTSLSGEAARIRIQFLPILLIFVGIGHGVVVRQRQEKRDRQLAAASSTAAGEVSEKHA